MEQARKNMADVLITMMVVKLLNFGPENMPKSRWDYYRNIRDDWFSFEECIQIDFTIWRHYFEWKGLIDQS